MTTAAPRRDNKTGTWWFVVDLPPAPNGRRRQAKRRGFPTKKAAQEALDELRVGIRKGGYVAPLRQTLRQYVEDDWLPSIVSTIDRDTLESYERNMRLHVLPVLGHVKLQEIDGSMLDRLYTALLADGSRKDGRAGGLKPRTVRYIHTIVHRALKDACDMDPPRLNRNPADRTKRVPSAKQSKAPEMKVWTREQLALFLKLSEGTHYHPAFLFLAMTGCRRGEALGLRWQDVDFERSVVTIRQQLTESGFKPYTKSSKPRVIELDQVTLATLRAWRARQAETRLALGAAYQDHGLVFCQVDGSPYYWVENFSREFTDRLRRNPYVGRVPPIRLHDLRHTWATLALIAGVDVKVVSERLGHSSPVVTWTIYQHVIKGMQADAAEKVASLVFGNSAR